MGATQVSESTYKEVVYYLLLLEYGILVSKPDQGINEWLVRCACVMLCMCLTTNRTPSTQS